MNPFHRFLELPPRERGWFLRMGALLVMIDLALKVAGFRFVLRALERSTPLRPGTQGNEACLALARRWKRHAKRHGHGTCLSRSLALWWLLRRHGIDTELRIGTRREGGRFLAHAWLEYQGRTLNANPTGQNRYTVFEHSFTHRRKDYGETG